ncbi:MAG: MerR family transcriptional regulator, partial [Spirochaetaceae bacterium]|nr:MerR family transcriptional regulator [Spirochaetaceae bacterium]
MYRIGQFSKIGKVTVKALRFYEVEGLIVPRRVDAATGYRYYDSSQIPLVHKIVGLRQCGFSIPDIRLILGGKNIAALFAARRAELERTLDESSRQLASIASYMESIADGNDMRYQVVIKELPRVVVYGMRTVVESYDAYYDLVPGIGEEIAAHNPDLRCRDDPPYCFIIYHDGEYKEKDIDIEYCEAVFEAGQDTPRLKFKTIERVPEAACVVHKGPYSELRAAYASVFKWIDDNGCICEGKPRES